MVNTLNCVFAEPSECILLFRLFYFPIIELPQETARQIDLIINEQF